MHYPLSKGKALSGNGMQNWKRGIFFDVILLSDDKKGAYALDRLVCKRECSVIFITEWS